MPKRPRDEKRPVDTVGPATHVAEIAGSAFDHSTPEEDALEKAARVIARKS